ncbi:hypothetical protein HGP14_29620 [Rhizobium sp. P32RR-XVIII]|uniref:hypothetical protein n=1 Tax=Rhizobium sp. P32RR-XVIII TaxID=2726738 RepID=UPI00145771E3|nr:hypothetical protein [Rhizobium sp. P32RR-XVIII]NLS07438.1 hypothetical protein [Rhizobium sp. P32RR-XVIII]
MMPPGGDGLGREALAELATHRDQLAYPVPGLDAFRDDPDVQLLCDAYDFAARIPRSQPRRFAVTLKISVTFNHAAVEDAS